MVYFGDVRALIYVGLRNVVVSLKGFLFLISLKWGKKLKLNLLRKKIYQKAKRFFEIPHLRQYVIDDGI